MNRLLLAAWLSLLATPLAAQTPFDTLTAERETYPTPMTKEQIGQMLNDTAWTHRVEGWGLLRKDAGNNCPSPPGPRISCDYLVNRMTGAGYDVLIDQEGLAVPSWQGPNFFDVAMWTGPVGTAPEPPPEPPVPPTPGPSDHDIIIVRLTALDRDLDSLLELLAEHDQRLSVLGQTLDAHVLSPVAPPVPTPVPVPPTVGDKPWWGDTLIFAMKYGLPLIVGLIGGAQVAQ